MSSAFVGAPHVDQSKMKLSDLRTLGRSGLPVSPFALGTMTMGNSAWGSPDDVSESVFNSYVDGGGNFIDTADVYSSGRSEELLGRFISDRNLRDRIVLATKYAFNFDTGGEVSSSPNPLAGGASRKNLYRALEGSLGRLKTDLPWCLGALSPTGCSPENTIEKIRRRPAAD